jgi:hypothetical protein
MMDRAVYPRWRIDLDHPYSFCQFLAVMLGMSQASQDHAVLMAQLFNRRMVQARAGANLPGTDLPKGHGGFQVDPFTRGAEAWPDTTYLRMGRAAFRLLQRSKEVL